MIRNIFGIKGDSIEDIADINSSKEKTLNNRDTTNEKIDTTNDTHGNKIDGSQSEEVDLEEVFKKDIAKEVAESGKIVDKAETREEFINNAIEKVIGYFTVESPSMLNSYDREVISKDDVKGYITTYVKKNVISSVYGKPNEDEVETIYKGFEKFVWGYDILEPLIEDITISDINITRHDRINLKVNGERKLSDVKFRSKEGYKRFVEHVAMKNRKSIADINAIRWFTDSNASELFTLRFNISTEVVNCVRYPYISIRKVPKFKYGFDKLIEMGMLTREQVNYLKGRILDGHSGIICGKGGSGKTILLNELLEVFPYNIRMDVIQDNIELFCDTHPDMMFHKTVEPEGEAKVRYDLDILGRNGLLEDLDAFIIGEVKGKEAAHLGHMAYTGHQVWCTTHAEGIYDAHYKIADYAKEITKEQPEKFMRKIKSMDTILFMNKFKLVDIGECVGVDDTGKLIIQKVCV